MKNSKIREVVAQFLKFAWDAPRGDSFNPEQWCPIPFLPFPSQQSPVKNLWYVPPMIQESYDLKRWYLTGGYKRDPGASSEILATVREEAERLACVLQHLRRPSEFAVKLRDAFIEEARSHNGNIPPWQEMRWEFTRGLTQGWAVWFFGLPGAGKSTLATALYLALHILESPLSFGPLVQIDGDMKRIEELIWAPSSLHFLLTSGGDPHGMDFSREYRAEKIKELSYLIGSLTRWSGIVVGSTCLPYQFQRETLYRACKRRLAFVYVKAPLEVRRQRKPHIYDAPIKDPSIVEFEEPSEKSKPPIALTIDTTHESLIESVGRVVKLLAKKGRIRPRTREDNIPMVSSEE